VTNLPVESCFDGCTFYLKLPYSAIPIDFVVWFLVGSVQVLIKAADAAENACTCGFYLLVGPLFGERCAEIGNSPTDHRQARNNALGILNNHPT
jgi:hypothetical protein